MTRLTQAGLTAAIFSFAVSTAFAQQKDERAGNCDQARSQMEYFCGGGDPNDMMMQFTACDNAKKNVAAACEGKVEADQAYKFDKNQ